MTNKFLKTIREGNSTISEKGCTRTRNRNVSTQECAKLRCNKIRIGFIGGGPNSFIGYTHRLAARFDNRFTFVAGVFSRNSEKSKQFAISLGIDSSRTYSDYNEMAENENKRDEGVEAIGIMTHSGEHYSVA